MKKIIAALFLMVLAMTVFGQTTITLTPDTAGTIAGTAGGVTHKFTSPRINNGPYVFGVEVYVTASGTHATDSTHVSIWGSPDGTNYFQITDLGTPWLLGCGAYNATAMTGMTYTGYRLSSSGATAGWYWSPAATYYLHYRYIQVRVTQYKALSVLTVNRCYLHLYK